MWCWGFWEKPDAIHVQFDIDLRTGNEFNDDVIKLDLWLLMSFNNKLQQCQAKNLR